MSHAIWKARKWPIRPFSDSGKRRPPNCVRLAELFVRSLVFGALFCFVADEDGRVGELDSLSLSRRGSASEGRGAPHSPRAVRSAVPFAERRRRPIGDIHGNANRRPSRRVSDRRFGGVDSSRSGRSPTLDVNPFVGGGTVRSGALRSEALRRDQMRSPTQTHSEG